ncbi:hypothetical protein ACFPTO_18540 [Paraburkholderia denitrificans]|uniref:Uncharacterized protein n=1 Tax=Paraburkholderia denitrificans TaxID=694025 RepID=A0ABW0JD01_9BURK
MNMRLSPELRKNLDWLADNWQRKQLTNLSPYHAEFDSALQNILADCASRQDVERVVEGTLFRVAEGYAFLLDVEPEELARDPWISLRRLGDIADRLRKVDGT